MTAPKDLRERDGVDRRLRHPCDHCDREEATVNIHGCHLCAECDKAMAWDRLPVGPR